MSKQFWGLILVIVLVLVGVFALTGHKSNTSSNTSAATNHVEGNAKSSVKLVEYGDYQCPYCQVYYSTVKQVVAQYTDQISFQFRNYPLTSIHQNAFAASRAAEAAGKQNKYWEMHDALYSNNDPNGSSGWVSSTSPTTFFNQFASQLGLNLAQFKTDYASQPVNDAINADTAAGNKLGITGTPTFYLNGKKIGVNNTVADFQKVITAALKTSSTGTGDTTTTNGTTSQTTPAAPATTTNQ